MAIQIGRREFIATLGAATAAAWPLAAHAQQSGGIRRVPPTLLAAPIGDRVKRREREGTR